MKLLKKDEYKKLEEYLREYKDYVDNKNYVKAINELVSFFSDIEYSSVLNIFYLQRNSYLNRFPTNQALFSYLNCLLAIPIPTLYVMRKEIVYKAAMIFYKYDLL